MKKHILAALALAACATFAQAQGTASTPAKKELIKRLMQLQQPGLEAMARSLTEQPAARMLQEAGRAMQADGWWHEVPGLSPKTIRRKMFKEMLAGGAA